MSAAEERERMRPGDEAPEDVEGVGEDLCRECGGSGERDGGTCAACGGTGRVAEGIGGA